MPRPVRPDFVYLDLGNVIVSFDRDRGLRQMVEVCGAEPTLVRAAGLNAEMHLRLERGEIVWPEYHEWFSRQTGTSSDPDALARAASDIFTLNIAMLPVIAGLERAGCPLGILSNTCGPHWEFLQACRYAILPGNFSHVVLSHEVGAVKPEPAIFAAAAAKVGVAADRIFFTDDIPAHVESARDAGWQAEVFTSAANLIDDLDRRGLKLGL